MRQGVRFFCATAGRAAPHLIDVVNHPSAIRRALLLVGTFALLGGGCVYDLNKLRGAQPADGAGGSGGGGTGGAGGTGGDGGTGGGGTGGGTGGGGGSGGGGGTSGGGGTPMPPTDARMVVDARGPIPDRPAGPDVIPTETVGYSALVAYWPLDEGQGEFVYDDTGNGNDGAFLFDPLWQPGGFPASTGRSAWKIRFDGNEDFIEVLPKTLPDIDKPKSICFWIRRDYEVDPGRDEAMVVLLNRSGAGSGLRIEFRKGELTATSYFYNKIVALPPPPLGWHHIAYTFDGNIHTLYLNGGANIDVGGVQMPGIATSMVPAEIGPANTKDGRFRMGRSSSGVADAFRGFLDDVRVYNRALTAAEVKSLSLGAK